MSIRSFTAKIAVSMLMTVGASVVFAESATSQLLPPNTGHAFSRQGELEDSDRRLSDERPFDYYTFHGLAGQTVVIDVYSSDFDTHVGLFDADTENLLAENNNDARFEDGTNSRMSFTLPADGDYRVLITTSRKTGRGDYTYAWRVREVDDSTPQFQSSDSLCNAAFAQFKEDLAAGRSLLFFYQSEAEVSLPRAYRSGGSSERLSERPPERPLNYTVEIDGQDIHNVMASPQLLLSLSTAFIEACDAAGTITVSYNRNLDSDQNLTFGLVNGRVVPFRCVGDNDPVPWGTTRRCFL